MPSNELKNLLIEYVRLLPRDCVTGIGHDRPLMIFHMIGPDAHQRRRCKQIGIRGDTRRFIMRVPPAIRTQRCRGLARLRLVRGMSERLV